MPEWGSHSTVSSWECFTVTVESLSHAVTVAVKRPSYCRIKENTQYTHSLWPKRHLLYLLSKIYSEQYIRLKLCCCFFYYFTTSFLYYKPITVASDILTLMQFHYIITWIICWLSMKLPWPEILQIVSYFSCILVHGCWNKNIFLNIVVG